MSVAPTTKSDSLWGVGSTNIFLQGLTLASRSLLILGLARFLTPAELGVFGLLLVTLNLSLYLVGLDFNAFNARELLRGNLEAAPAKIRDQFVFHGITYVAALPLILPVFFWGIIPWDLSFLFYVLLILEHVAQELQRILITLHRSVHAAAVFFIRSGAWVFVVLGLMVYDARFRTVQTLAISWATGVALSLIPAVYLLRDLPWRTGTRAPVDWAWLRRGVVVSLPFLSASLAFRGIMSADRFALERYTGTDAVGVYTFYVGVRNAIQSLLDVGVIAVMRPRIVQAYQTGNPDLYKSLMRRLTVSVTGLTLVLCLMAAVAIRPILVLIDNPTYGQHLSAYWILLAITLVMSLADIPHTILYARHQDRAIAASSLIGLTVALVANVLLVSRHGLVGAALATLLALIVFGGLKTFWAVRGGVAT